MVMEAVEYKLMTQLVDFSTQVKGNILDLVITNMPERVLEVREEGRLGKSDHLMIVTEISVGGVAKKNQIPLPDWRRADWTAMRTELEDRAWINRVRSSNMEAAWQLVKGKVEELTRKYVPVRRRRNQNRPAWMTQEILRPSGRRRGSGRQLNLRRTRESTFSMKKKLEI